MRSSSGPTVQLLKWSKQTQNRNTLLHSWNGLRAREEHKQPWNRICPST
jgi:hypothetical protein